jgi:4-amino-4-deoxy-L-arabinose transferase-like glycosyltransferase
VAAIAVALAVSSPTFLLMQQQVMSDVPVAAFVVLSIAASLRPDRAWLAGLAAGAAILVRPNLVPLVAFPFALVVLHEGPWLRRAIAFAAPVCIAAAAVGALNWFYNGSPLISGYGNLASFYSLAAIPQNARLYSRWMFSTHTPFFLIGALAPFVTVGDWRHRARVGLVTLLLPIAMLVLFLPFLVFHENDWGYTRFLIPGYTGLAVGCGMVAVSAVERARRSRTAVALATAGVAAVAAFGWTFAVRNGVFLQRHGDHRFAEAVAYTRELPPRTILVSNSHSGTLRHYTGRDVLRFETVPPEEIDIAVEYLLEKGYHLVFIGDEFELEQFQTRFAGCRVLARLGRKPRAAFSGVVAYDIR